MLIKGLPRDALVRTPESERGRDPWTAELELLAQLIELTSIKTAGMRLRKPIKVSRPKKEVAAKAAAAGTERAVAVAPGANPYQSAIRAFGASQPSRVRAAQDAVPDPAPRLALGDPGAFGTARRAFGAVRLPTATNQERNGT